MATDVRHITIPALSRAVLMTTVSLVSKDGGGGTLSIVYIRGLVLVTLRIASGVFPLLASGGGSWQPGFR